MEDFDEAITLSAQTALRESIGRHELAADDHRARDARAASCSASSTRRRTRGASPCSRWRSATCSIPQALEDAMSRQAQAERERQARIILGTAETEISDKFARPRRGLPRQPGRAAPARDEHAVRGHQGDAARW